MRINILAKGYPPIIGGVENYSCMLAEGLSSKHEVNVTTFRHYREKLLSHSRSLSVTGLILSKMEYLNAIKLFFHLIFSLLKYKPEIIIATTWKVGLTYSLLKPIFNIPMIVVVHGAEITRHQGNRLVMCLMKNTLRRADRIIAISEFTKNILQQYSSCNINKIQIIKNGIELDKIKVIDIKDAKDKLKCSDKFVILTVSRIDMRKGHKLVLNQIAKLKNNYSDILYYIVGDGPQRKYLEDLVIRLDIEKNVHFTGFVPTEDLYLFYNACDIFVMVNTIDKDNKDFEGFGLVFAEAGAYKKPCIGGNNAGAKEVILHGDTGYLVDMNSSEDLLNYITKLYNSEETRAMMGERAQEHIKKYFNINRFLQDYEKSILDLIGN